MPIPIGIPIAALAIKGIADFLGNKSKADAEKAARVMYNEWLQDRSLTAAQIAANLAQRGIDIYGPQVTTTSATGSSTGTSQSNTRSQGTSTSTSAPVVDPDQAKIKAWLEGSIAGMPEQITEGEKAAMLGQIGAGERAGLTDVSNRAAKMNLGGTSLQSAMLSNPVTNAANYQRSQYLGKDVPQMGRDLYRTKQGAAAGSDEGLGEHSRHQRHQPDGVYEWQQHGVVRQHRYHDYSAELQLAAEFSRASRAGGQHTDWVEPCGDCGL